MTRLARNVNSLGELICLGCGTHMKPTNRPRFTCSVRCRMRLRDRGGKLSYEEVQQIIRMMEDADR